ncbi:3D domain-containing protein [Paenibacillus chitinolyticus]|uniref:3D domain-containing protein n=1 Tax=Paenibacillus chitinolyticus TaxID=79263 RepID=UPI003558E4F8
MSENRTLSFIFMAMLLLLIGCESNENVKDPKEKTQPTIEMPLKPIRNLVHLEIHNTPSPSLDPIPSTTKDDVESMEVNDKTTKNKEIKNISTNKTFQITAYTNNFESTGKNPGDKYYGVTASGQKTKEGVTVACPKSMPFGTQIYIPYFDNTYTCTDRGGAIKEGRLDVFMSSESKAVKFGRRKLEVQIIEKKGE